MKWNLLTELNQLNEIDKESTDKKVFIFKHSTRCNISTAAMDRIVRKWKEGDSDRIIPYYLDLLSFRAVSNEIAERYKVEHQSPQVLLIENGACTSMDSHFDITYDGLMQKISA